MLTEARIQNFKSIQRLQLSLGRVTVLIGENGSGKTTMALAVLRLLPATGTAVFMGRDLLPLRQKELRGLRRDLQIVFQDPYGSLSPRMSILDIIGEGLEVHGIPRE